MRPHTFDTYCHKYESISLERTPDGVLTVTLHEPGQPDRALEYGGRPIDWHSPHLEWSYCFNDIARDRDNEVVIITAAGERFIGHHRIARVDGKPDNIVVPDDETGASLVGRVPPVDIKLWDTTLHNGAHIQMGLLNIDVPVIGAVNGPALTHADLVVQSDIVICTDTTVFADQAHFEAGMFAPGDGVAEIWLQLIGRNRGRYFLLTGQRIGAREALELGIVSEIVSRDRLLPRAHELAQQLLQRPRLVRRYARQLMVHDLKKRMLDHVGYALALEGLTVMGREMAAPAPAAQ
jgi:enoyl-CoA hydratase/carnithine racemase